MSQKEFLPQEPQSTICVANARKKIFTFSACLANKRPCSDYQTCVFQQSPKLAQIWLIFLHFLFPAMILFGTEDGQNDQEVKTSTLTESNPKRLEHNVEPRGPQLARVLGRQDRDAAAKLPLQDGERGGEIVST